jgi:RHS repeat-associated protein
VNDAGTVTTNNRFNESLTYADARGNIGTLRRQGPLAAGGCTYGQIDNLTYTYYTGMNRLKTITDGSTPMGFKQLAGATDYIYDVNGNMTTDPHKGLTITYNHLNLPKTFNFGGGKIIDIIYDAAGNKLKKTIIGSASNYDQDYIGGIEYRSGVREAIYTAEGRVFYTSPTATRYEYTIKDHLGNARLSFSDVNTNGTVDFATEVLQENHYYPFGLNFDGNWKNDAARDNRYQYNGKEINDDFGLNWNDYGARWYDGSVGRWWSVDPLAEKSIAWSSYNYVICNPLKLIDPDGMRWVNPYEKDSEEHEIVQGIFDDLKNSDSELYDYIDNLSFEDSDGNTQSVNVFVYLSDKEQSTEKDGIKPGDAITPIGVSDKKGTFNGKKINVPGGDIPSDREGDIKGKDKTRAVPGVFDVLLYRKNGQKASSLANEAGNIMFAFEYNKEQKKEIRTKGVDYNSKPSERYSYEVARTFNNRRNGDLTGQRDMYPLLFIKNKIIPHDKGAFKDK